MIGATRWRFRSVGSTQDVTFALAAKGANHGTVVRADYQTAGRGRLGRSWQAPIGTALTFSTLLRPTFATHELGPLSIRIAAVLADAFTALGANDVSIKWPNDVLIGGRKTSGILVQTRTMPELVVVVGIGINLSDSPEGATNLQQAIDSPVSADHVLDVICSGLDPMWTNWQPELNVDEVRAIEDRLWLRGEQVTLLDADREITGTIAGISPDGGLRLLTDGTERLLHVGEITRGPRLIIPGK